MVIIECLYYYYYYLLLLFLLFIIVIIIFIISFIITIIICFVITIIMYIYMYIIIMFLWKAIIWGDATIYFRSMSWWLFRGPDSKVPRKERAWAKGTPWIWLIWAQGVGKIKPAKMLIEKKNMEIKPNKV